MLANTTTEHQRTKLEVKNISDGGQTITILGKKALLMLSGRSREHILLHTKPMVLKSPSVSVPVAGVARS